MTGAILSGKGWIGRKLREACDLPYVHELLNPLCPPGLPLEELTSGFPYIENDPRSPLAEKVARYLTGHTPWVRSVRNGGTLKDRLSLLKANYLRRKAFAGGPVMVKCPFSIFSIPYFIDQLEFEVVFSLRNPLDLVASAKAGGTNLDFQMLARNKRLLDRCFPQFKERVEGLANRAHRKDMSIVESITHFWIIANTYAVRLLERYEANKHIHFVSLNQLNQDPHTGFGNLLTQLEKALGRPFKAFQDPQQSQPESGPKRDPDPEGNFKVWTRGKTLSILSEEELQFITEMTSGLSEEIKERTGARI